MADTGDFTRAVASEAVKAAPSAAVVTASIVGLNWQDWASIAAIAFIGLQAMYLLWKWHRDWRVIKTLPKPTVPPDAAK